MYSGYVRLNTKISGQPIGEILKIVGSCGMRGSDLLSEDGTKICECPPIMLGVNNYSNAEPNEISDYWVKKDNLQIVENKIIKVDLDVNEGELQKAGYLTKSEKKPYTYTKDEISILNHKVINLKKLRKQKRHETNVLDSEIDDIDHLIDDLLADIWNNK